MTKKRKTTRSRWATTANTRIDGGGVAPSGQVGYAVGGGGVRTERIEDMRRIPISKLVLTAALAVSLAACSGGPYQQGETLERQGSYELAIEQYELAAADNPGSSGALKAQMKIASIYHVNLEQPEKAAEVYAAIIEAAPDEEIGLNAQYQLGLVHYGIGDYDAAAEAFRGLLMNAPSSEQGGDAQMMLAQTYEKAGKLDEAQATYGEFSRLHSENKNAVIALEKRARLLDNLGKKEEAIQQRQDIVREFGARPDAEQVVRLAAEELVKAGAEVPDIESMETSAADREMERQQERRERDRPRSQPREEEQTKSAEELIFGHNADDIMSAMQITLDDQGTMYDAMFSMASVLFTTADYKKSGALYHRSLRMAEKAVGSAWESRASAIKGLSDVYLKLGLEDRAKQLLEDAVRTDSAVIDQVITQGEYEYGVGDYQKAVDIWSFVAGFSAGKDSQIYYLIGLAQRELQNTPAEVKAFERSLAANPRNEEAAQSLAEALYYRAGNRKRAFLYQDIIDKKIDWPTYFDLGKTAMRYGYWQQASQQFNIGARVAAKAAERAAKNEDARAEKQALNVSIGMAALKQAARARASESSQDEAAVEMAALAQGNPQNALVRYAAGHLAEHMNETEKAAAEYAKAIELEPINADFVEALANLHIANDNAAEAVNVYSAYLQKNPRDKRIQSLRDTLKAETISAPSAAP